MRPAWHHLVAALGLLLATLPACAAEWIYTARSGDNLWDLAREYLTSMRHWREFRRINDVPNPRSMQPGTAVRFPEEWLRVEPAAIVVEAVSGSVMVAGTGQSPAAVVPGITLRRGDRLRSDATGSALLRLPDGSGLLMRPRTELEVGPSGVYGRGRRLESRAVLQRGGIEGSVLPDAAAPTRLEITTPSAQAVVRGTQFRVSSDDADSATRAEVETGVVDVSAAGRTRAVPAGKGTLVRRGQPPSPPRALLPAPDVSSIPAVVERLQGRMRWQAVASAVGYQVQLGSAESLSTLLLDTRVDRARVDLPELTDGRYVLKVRAIAADGLNGIQARAVFELDAFPQPPVNISPQPDQTVRTATPELRWSAPTDAVGYRLQLARDEGFADLVMDRDALTDNRLTLEQALPRGRYYWRLATRDAAGETGPYGDTQLFVVRPAPFAPIARAQADGETVLLRWQAGDEGQTYEVMVSDDAEMSRNVRTRKVLKPQLALPPITQDLWFKVRIIDTDGYEGPWGTVQRVAAPPEPVDMRWLLLLPLPLLFAL